MNTTAKPNLLRAAATYGLYIGLFLILCHLLTSVSGGKIGFLITIIKLAGSIGLLVYGMKRYRDMNCGGFITYGNAFGYGILTSLFSTFLYVAYFYVTIATNRITFQEQMYLAYDELIERGLIDGGMVDTLVQNMDWLIPLGLLIWSMVLGLIYSLIIAAAIMRKKPIFE